jgi:hypothetical protein
LQRHEIKFEVDVGLLDCSWWHQEIKYVLQMK